VQGNPDGTSRKLEQVARVALVPREPSGQYRYVAVSADEGIAAVRQGVPEKKREEIQANVGAVLTVRWGLQTARLGQLGVAIRPLTPKNVFAVKLVGSVNCCKPGLQVQTLYKERWGRAIWAVCSA
jgi:hypothetical protein